MTNESAARRAAAYWFSDGLPDMIAGVAFLAVGGARWWEEVDYPPWPLSGLVTGAALAVGALVLWKYRAILEFLKERLTYPRTGYVRAPSLTPDPGPTVLGLSPRTETPPGAANASRYFVLFTGGWGLGACVFLPLLGAGWVWPIVTFLLAGLLFFLTRHTEHPCDWPGLVPLAASGFAFVHREMTPNGRAGALTAVMGTYLLVRGLWTLALYLRRHPRREAARV
ncbi:MAG: hypothetical protein ABSH28_19820 [Acidobacteriota bacterium]|jgi:hypothetical protein